VQLQFGNCAIEIVQGDITRLEVEGIVNAANTQLKGGGGVDGAIHRAAGPELLEACREIGGCPTGEAVVTPGFRLPARYVIHTPGPVYRDGNHDEAGLLAACYRNCFERAREKGVRTLAFPAISCGIYRFPLDEATGIPLSETRRAVSAYPEVFERVVFCAFDAKTFRAYQTLAPAIFGGTEEV
jgi:O-acetyl-ADP-ribose deacetylase (regulator of RNase III)